jgi:hypothetical protein
MSDLLDYVEEKYGSFRDSAIDAIETVEDGSIDFAAKYDPDASFWENAGRYEKALEHRYLGDMDEDEVWELYGELHD